MSLHKTVQVLEACLREWDYLNAYYCVFGIYAEEVTDHIQLGAVLLREHKRYRQASLYKRSGHTIAIRDSAQVLAGFRQALEALQDSKKRWNNDFIRVICSEQKFKEIALKVKADGSVAFPKSEVEKYFDFSRARAFWKHVPGYTTVFLGGAGISLASPEYDMFHAMCWSYNEALRTHREWLRCQEKLKCPEFEIEDAARLRDATGLHFLMCQQTIINSFLLVEAYLNSLAHLHVSNPSSSLSDDERRFLTEKRLKKDGSGEEQKFVATQVKLHQWVKTISPRGQTFDKGQKPYQEFMEVKAYRDSIVHFSSDKLAKYRTLNFDVSRRAVFMAIEIIEKISEFISPKKEDVQHPFWLCHPQDDGMFHLNSSISFDKPTQSITINGAYKP